MKNRNQFLCQDRNNAQDEYCACQNQNNGKYKRRI